MNKYYKIPYFSGILSLILFTAGILIKQTGYANQLIFFFAACFFAFFLFIPLWTVNNAKLSSGVNKTLAVLAGLFNGILLFILPYAMTDGSIPPFLAASILISVIILYLILKYRDEQNLIRSEVRMDLLFIAVFVFSFMNAPFKGQAPNKLFKPYIDQPKYENGLGPTIYLDEAHHNFHTLDGLYWAFGELMRADGYNTSPFTTKFSNESLDKVEVLVISNAINEKNKGDWNNPSYSAFTEDEQEAIENWVSRGGSLFLIADHMPFGGAAQDLASQFDVDFRNGFAMDTLKLPDFFTRTQGTLNQTILSMEEIDTILTFTGQAFRIPSNATSILLFDKKYLQWEPDRAWDFDGVEPYSIEGFSQLAFMEYGKGKVVFSGEAMMFTSQLGFGLSWKQLGFTDPRAVQNQKLLLNIIHWLDE